MPCAKVSSLSQKVSSFSVMPSQHDSGAFDSSDRNLCHLKVCILEAHWKDYEESQSNYTLSNGALIMGGET